MTRLLHQQMAKFWEIDDGPSVPFISNTETACMRHYDDNVHRNSTGRYVVKLPFNEKINNLGDSHKMASRCFLTLERKLATNSEVKIQYNDFLREYLQLGHMKEVKPSLTTGYYLPHHSVIKSASLTTKVRVVLDGSAKTSTGISLNDALMVGPTIQSDLFSIIIRFRFHAYVLTADIEKMYRQVLVHPSDTKYQRILWRENPSDEIKTYELQTVTYGLASAPYLAIRSLHKLAEDEHKRYPRPSAILTRDFYVDDLLTGTDSYEEAKILRDELTTLLQQGGFNLRKWSSNEPSLIESLTDNTTNDYRTLDSSQPIKTLGIQWDPRLDAITYNANQTWTRQRTTKRNMLAFIAKIFDPLGLVGPIVIQAKIVMQQLWLLKTGWDDPVPNELHNSWLAYISQLHFINQISIPRRIALQNASELELHGFCDASERAYGACIYVRLTNERNRASILVCARSRVAPLKTISLPRLELCAALLLTRLLRTTSEALKLQFSKVQCWSDSTITLQWINTPPHTLKTFVANRVAEIQETTTADNWRHVPSQDNPADLISRGLLASDLVGNHLWFRGPPWLINNDNTWPQMQIHLDNIPEQRKITALVNTVPDYRLLTKYSSISTTIRIMAWCLRFTHNTQKRIRYTGSLKTSELEDARIRVIQLIQRQEFAREIHDLSQGAAINRSSQLRALNPFLDNKGVLRVGGRLTNSYISYNAKHPIILPRKHHVTMLILRNAHIAQWHGGLHATLYAVRQHYWPIDGKNTLRWIIHKCLRCFRARPQQTNYLMGNLPGSRLRQARPFLNCGVDYCGPFHIKEKMRRNRNKLKVYIAIFVCFTTKAVHLELVSNLTTEAFIGSLRRFIARRGKCDNIHSDNATNFSGANRELSELHALMKSQPHNDAVSNFLANQNIQWHFIPPRASHFGGLWKAAVKSFKRHLHRTVGETLLTYEQFYTYATEIEAILNSRPLTPLSSDPNDLMALTPGHFLISTSLLSIPEHDFSETPVNRLSAWQHIQRMRRHFWKRWHTEYLNHLNCRSKWQFETTPIKEGTLVVLREENVDPLHWPLGRIVAVHPGLDHIGRVVAVQTTSGIYKRSVKRVSPLPIDDNESLQ